MLINQGDIYWVQLHSETESAIPHPHVILQENVFNHSRITTVIACSLTTNMKKINVPGNILLESDEGDLPKQSIVEVSKISTIEKSQLGDYIGSLSEKRVHQILAQLAFLQKSFFSRE